jgi:GNAT superfamily N-acetyltransferase
MPGENQTVRPPTARPLTVERLGDLEELFGTNKTTQGCYCMWFLSPIREVHSGWGTVNRDRFNALAAEAREPMGLLAYRDGEAVGWCAAGPRARYARMLKAPTLRNRDPAEDERVWLVPCFFVRRDARRTGVMTTLLQAATRLARKHGAPAIEGFPRAGDQRHSAADAYLGVEPLFAACGFSVVDRPSAARVIMRRDL